MTNEVQKAMQTVIEALQNDPEYAWSWHCNIAMAFVDAGGDHYIGNHGAARFMKLLANVEPAHALPTSQAPTQEPEQPAKRHGYKEAYIEAMVASNEAGFVGLSAAETIRELANMLDKRAEQPAQQEPVAGLLVGQDSDGRYVSIAATTHADTLPLGEYKLYTSPPASKPLTDEQKKELFKEWANAIGVWPSLTHQEIFYAGIEAAHEITNE